MGVLLGWICVPRASLWKINLQLVEVFDVGDAQLNGLRFVSNLILVYFTADPVGKFVIDLFVEQIRIPFNSFVTKAIRIELLLRVVDFPIQRAQVFFLGF